MPIQSTDPRAYAEAAIASLSTLATLDPSLSPAIAAAIGALRAKYPDVSAGPTDPPEAAPKPSVI